MSDASSNPNLEISEGESSLKSPLLETMQNEVQLPAEKVEMPPKRAPAGPEDHFKVGTVRLFFPRSYVFLWVMYRGGSRISGKGGSYV